MGIYILKSLGVTFNVMPLWIVTYYLIVCVVNKMNKTLLSLLEMKKKRKLYCDLMANQSCLHLCVCVS